MGLMVQTKFLFFCMQINIKEFSPYPIAFPNHAQIPDNWFLDVDDQVVN
jgi:hypothetical protein